MEQKASVHPTYKQFRKRWLQYKNISIKIKLPQQGAGAADELIKISQRYIYESLNCDVPMGAQLVGNLADYAMTKLLSKFAPKVGLEILLQGILHKNL